MNLFENLCMMKESDQVKTFNISYKANEVFQANLIKGYSEEQVTEYFKEYKPDAEILGVKIATRDDEKPGKPVIDATKEIVKEASEPVDEVPVFEADYVFNGKRLEVTLTEVEEFINVYINDDVHLQEPKEYVKDDHDLEYLAFTTAVDFYKELKFADKIEEAAILKDDKDLEKVVEATELNTISGSDIYAWQGANDFTDGSKPLIAHGDGATMLVSGPEMSTETGAIVSIYYGEEGTSWAFKSYDSKEDAISAAKELLPLIDNVEFDENELADKGFTLV